MELNNNRNGSRHFHISKLVFHPSYTVGQYKFITNYKEFLGNRSNFLSKMLANNFHHFCLLFFFIMFVKSATANCSHSSTSSSSPTSTTTSSPSPSSIEANSILLNDSSESSITTSSFTLNTSTTIMMMDSNNATQKTPLLNDSVANNNGTINSTTSEMANSINSSTTSTPESISSTESAAQSNSSSTTTTTPIPVSSSSTSSATVSTNSTSFNLTISHLIGFSPIHSANSSNVNNAIKLLDSTDKSGEHAQYHHESLERHISDEDVSGNKNGDLEEENGRNGEQNDRQLRNGRSFNRGELPLLPAHFVLSVQKHADAEGKITNIPNGLNNSSSKHSKLNNKSDEGAVADFPSFSSSAPENESNGTKIIRGDGNRNKRDYVSDAINKMNEAMGNAQSQQQQMPVVLPNVNNGSGLDGAQQPAQIISIPPIDLSGKTQNIVLVSDTGNVTLRRGNGFLSVETIMVQQQP